MSFSASLTGTPQRLVRSTCWAPSSSSGRAGGGGGSKGRGGGCVRKRHLRSDDGRSMRLPLVVGSGGSVFPLVFSLLEIYIRPARDSGAPEVSQNCFTGRKRAIGVHARAREGAHSHITRVETCMLRKQTPWQRERSSSNGHASSTAVMSDPSSLLSRYLSLSRRLSICNRRSLPAIIKVMMHRLNTAHFSEAQAESTHKRQRKSPSCLLSGYDSIIDSQINSTAADGERDIEST